MIPVALNLKNKNVLIVGGGKVALSRVQRYLEEGAHITVVSPSFIDELKELPVVCIEDRYQKHYLEGMFFVYSATQYREVNHEVVMDCQDMNILCGSATKDEDASFYGMPHRNHEVGMVAYSSHQKFPYASPILDELMEVVDRNKEKLALLAQLRPYVLKVENYDKSVFNELYHASDEFLGFLLASIHCQQGIVFVYHKNRFNNTYRFPLNPHISLSIEEFEAYKHLLIFDVHYIIVPLVLYDGRIYHQMVDGINSHCINIGPVIQDDNDARMLLEMLENGNDLFIMHDRKNSQLKQSFKAVGIGEIYDLKDTIMIEKNKHYHMTVLLFGKGVHYEDMKAFVEEKNREGYSLEFMGNLLEKEEFYDYLMNKIRQYMK